MRREGPARHPGPGRRRGALELSAWVLLFRSALFFGVAGADVFVLVVRPLGECLLVLGLVALEHVAGIGLGVVLAGVGLGGVLGDLAACRQPEGRGQDKGPPHDCTVLWSPTLALSLYAMAQPQISSPLPRVSTRVL